MQINLELSQVSQVFVGERESHEKTDFSRELQFVKICSSSKSSASLQCMWLMSCAIFILLLHTKHLIIWSLLYVCCSLKMQEFIYGYIIATFEQNGKWHILNQASVQREIM